MTPRPSTSPLHRRTQTAPRLTGTALIAELHGTSDGPWTHIWDDWHLNGLLYPPGRPAST